MNAILTLLEPALLSVLSTIVTALIAWAAAKFTALTHVQIEAKQREALHSAIMTGIGLAMSKQLTGTALVTAAVSYAKTSVPDSIAGLKADDNILSNLVTSKLSQVLGAGSS